MSSGLVLSGGGARGAYEAGLLAGMFDVLGLKAGDRAPFDLFAGTSVGAINATYLAAHADRGDMAIEGLIDIWEGLSLRRHLKVDTLRFLGLRDKLPFARRDGTIGRSLLDPKPIYKIVEDGVPWDRLHHNIKSGRVKGLLVTALHIASGTTHIFTELSPDTTFAPSLDPVREAVPGPIGSKHVLASCALPLVFPSFAIDGAYYCDGGLRFNTPLAPAIRAGADRLVVVPLIRTSAAVQEEAKRETIRRKSDSPGSKAQSEELYPSPFFLLGKLLNALILDPISYDLKVLERFNMLMNTLDAALTKEEKDRLDAALHDMRGAPYRVVKTLSFHPSMDLGRLAGEYLEKRTERAGFIVEALIQRSALLRETYEADLVSFLLFDGEYSRKLVEAGRKDAEARADDIRTFFGH